MAAFLMADVLPDDIEAYRDSGYIAAAGASYAKYGGVKRAAGGETIVLEGDWEEPMVIIEFPSMEQLLAWYHSDEYREVGAGSATLGP